MSEQSTEVETAQTILKDPWKVLSEVELSSYEVEDLRSRFSVAKVARQWSKEANTQSSDIFCPTESEARSMEWDVFRPSGREGPLRIGRRTELVLPFRKPVTSLTDCKSSHHLFNSISHALIEWLDMLQHGYLHGNISLGTVFALDESDDEQESDLGSRFSLQKLKDIVKSLPIPSSEGKQKEAEKGLYTETMDAIGKLEDFIQEHKINQPLPTTLANSGEEMQILPVD